MFGYIVMNKPEIKMKYVYYYDSVSNNPWLDVRFPNTTAKEKAEQLADMRKRQQQEDDA